MIRELVQVGLVRDQTAWMIDILDDPALTGLVIVTTPEEMPVTETIELLGRLDATRPASPPAAVIANRVLPALFDRRETGGRRPARRASSRRSSIAAVGPAAPTRCSPRPR